MSDSPEIPTAGQRHIRPSQEEFEMMQQASRVMLGWSALFCGVAVSVCVLLGFVLAGRPGGYGALTAGLLVLFFFVLGHVIELLTLNRADGFGLAGQVISFVVRIVLFAVALWLIARETLTAGTLSRIWLGMGAVVALLGWQVGMVLGHTRARIPSVLTGSQDDQ